MYWQFSSHTLYENTTPVYQNDPCVPEYNPCIPKYNPCIPEYNPCVPEYDPCIPEYDPCVPEYDPCVPEYDPCIPEYDPCVSEYDSCVPEYTKSAGYKFVFGSIFKHLWFNKDHIKCFIVHVSLNKNIINTSLGSCFVDKMACLFTVFPGNNQHKMVIMLQKIMDL